MKERRKVMTDVDLVCPDCSHPLGMHQYFYGVCEAPIGGFFTHDKCGCGLTLHDLIQNLQAQDLSKDLKELQAQHQTCIDELANCHGAIIQELKRIMLLESTASEVKEVLGKIKLVDTPPFYAWFLTEYKNVVYALVDRALLELEKTNE